jgi:hypothetical protein
MIAIQTNETKAETVTANRIHSDLAALHEQLVLESGSDRRAGTFYPKLDTAGPMPVVRLFLDDVEHGRWKQTCIDGDELLGIGFGLLAGAPDWETCYSFLSKLCLSTGNTSGAGQVAVHELLNPARLDVADLKKTFRLISVIIDGMMHCEESRLMDGLACLLEQWEGFADTFRAVHPD